MTNRMLGHYYFTQYKTEAQHFEHYKRSDSTGSECFPRIRPKQLITPSLLGLGSCYLSVVFTVLICFLISICYCDVSFGGYYIASVIYGTVLVPGFRTSILLTPGTKRTKTKYSLVTVSLPAYYFC